MTSPTARTLQECRKRGWLCQVVERFNPYAKVRQDLFEVIDIVACVPEDLIDEGIETRILVRRPAHVLGIQATTMTNRTKRLAKMQQSVKAAAWMNCGGRLELWCWRKLKPRGTKRVKWELHVTTIEPKDRAWLMDKKHTGPNVLRPSQAYIRDELRGKNLACWCKIGDPCHADVLLEIANA